jgi:NAD+ diphosphatase
VTSGWLGQLPQGQLPLARATHDRAAHLRGDEHWLSAAWTDPSTRVLVVAGGRVPLDGTGSALAFCRPDEVPAGERMLLGVDADRAYFTVGQGDQGHRSRSAGLRDVGAALSDRDAGLAVHAISLTNWHLTHRHCARCGSATQSAQAGQCRRCDSCAATHFPRTDPAVIMLVTDPADRCLLGHQAAWPAARFSTLAGFVEPGETPERAVVREVAEEVGIAIGAVRYAGAQPWPFPSSLMLGYFAQALSTDIRVDRVEISAAAWFSRVDLAAAIEQGRVQLPGAVSIARGLIERWYGGALPGG